jgi:hypothetical protein
MKKAKIATRRNTLRIRARRRPARKEETLLASVAESIGSTLGVIAAKAGAARNALRTRKPRQKSRRK